MRVGEVSGSLGVLIGVSEGVTAVAVMVRGVEERLVTEGKVEFGVVREGESVEPSEFQEDKNQAKQ